jgi:hypothetical protein
MRWPMSIVSRDIVSRDTSSRRRSLILSWIVNSRIPTVCKVHDRKEEYSHKKNRGKFHAENDGDAIQLKNLLQLSILTLSISVLV